jgi:ketosteroid isomerase-like protein
MSRANVEALSRGLAAYDSRDVEALLQECHDDVEWESALVKGLGGETTVYRGHDGIRELFREVDHAFDEFRIGFDEDDIRDLGDRIVASGWMRVRGRASGVAIESPVSFVADFRDGKAIRFRSFLDQRDALEAAGLSA